MTDLKDLLDNAAGDEPAITEDVLDADLNRGRRSVNRRRSLAFVAAAGTAAIAIGGWAFLPDSAPRGNGSEPAAEITTRPTQLTLDGRSPSSRLIFDGRNPSGKATPPSASDPRNPRTPPPMPWASRPVPLVRDDTPVPGATVHCSLIPEGWRTEGRGGYVRQYDPKSTYPTHAPDPQDHTWLPEGDGIGVTIGPFGDKVGTGWKAQVNAHTNGKEAAVFTDTGNPTTGRPGEIFVRITSSLTVQVHIGPRTGWDIATALRFAGSCDPVR